MIGQRLDEFDIPPAGPVRPNPARVRDLRSEPHLVPVDDEPPWFEADDPPTFGGQVETSPRREGLSALGWNDLLAQPPDPPPVLRPGLPKVGVTVLAGSPKVGKTLLAGQWALESRQPVTLIIEEGSLAGISFRFRRQVDGLALEPPDLTILHRQRVRLDDRTSVRRLREYLTVRKPALVVFDPLNRLHGADENRPTQMTPVMDALAGIAYDLECAVLAIHHLGKASQDHPRDIWDRFRGASAIRSGTDANLALDGSGDRLRLVGEFRDAEPLSEYLQLDREWLLFRPDEPPRLAGKVATAELIAFAQERGRITARDVMDRFGCAKATALTALEGTPELDRSQGPRGQLSYFVTVQ
jgi:hypothetical protein